jgi:asparagine synthase (glutamine-hydrolysing)
MLRAVRGPAAPPPWTTPALARRVGLAVRMRAAFDRVPGARHLVVRESLVRLTSGEGAFVRDALDRMGEAAGVELRHPFLDRRVVEFLIGLPDHLRWRQGIHRYLLRQTFGAVLPDSVRTRLDKPDIDHVVTDALRAIDPAAWLDHLEVVARGWVREDVVRDLWQRTDHAGRARQTASLEAPLALWNIFALEAWWRGVFSTSNHVAAVRRTPPVPL